MNIHIVNGTIPHEINVKYGATRIFLKPAKQGTGIIAGGALRSVLELSGIKNIVSKIHGSTNKINNARAVMIGLQTQRDIAQVAKERGIDAKLLGWKPPERIKPERIKPKIEPKKAESK